MKDESVRRIASFAITVAQLEQTTRQLQLAVITYFVEKVVKVVMGMEMVRNSIKMPFKL